MFESDFLGSADKAVKAGATISCVVDGIRYVATIHRDDDSGAPDKNDEGFWPSRNPSSPGYIGENPSRSFEDQQAECEEVMRRYRRRRMVYCGVVVTAQKAGVELVEPYEFALWGVDINWPFGDNSYLRCVANELLSEAQPQAEKNLAKKTNETRALLNALEWRA
jgi:hypothetical protein